FALRRFFMLVGPHTFRPSDPTNSNCCTTRRPVAKRFSSTKTIAGGRISCSTRGKHHARSTTVHLGLPAAHLFSRSSTRRASSGYLVRRSAGSARQSEFPDKLHGGRATHDRKRSRPPPLVPIPGVRADVHGGG